MVKIIEVRCPDCRRQLSIFSTESRIECHCESLFDVVKTDNPDMPYALRHVKWHRSRPSSEMRLDMYFSQGVQPCFKCGCDMKFPVQQHRITCHECGHVYDIKRRDNIISFVSVGPSSEVSA